MVNLQSASPSPGPPALGQLPQTHRAFPQTSHLAGSKGAGHRTLTSADGPAMASAWLPAVALTQPPQSPHEPAMPLSELIAATLASFGGLIAPPTGQADIGAAKDTVLIGES
ncbi:hypothetical protein FDECE_1733 [Fusarium decemcellulare]|nr:hypothetical protein FDECE_1733 [Fusarium decemcellulare]